MINLEIPKKFEFLVAQAHQVANEIFRTNSRKYDGHEHGYPKELDMLAAVIDGMNERKAFGEPISSRQAVAFTVSNIAIELDGMRLATYRAASRVDQGASFAREAALARRLCAERGMAIGSDGVQLLGGHGYTKEHPVERWYRDLRAAGVMEGALVV